MGGWSNWKKAGAVTGLVFVSLVVLGTGVFIVRRPTTAKKVEAAAGLPVLPYKILQVLGQPNEKETMVNLISGDRGFHLGGVHVDSNGRIYVFDSGNNRILGFTSYGPDRPADIVIGQPGVDAVGTANGDNTRYNNPTAQTLALLPYPGVSSTLEAPRMGQMASDAQGNFYVVDLNNNRVLKFSDPFGTDQVADEVWGQSDMTSRTAHCGTNGVAPSASGICTEYPSEFNGLNYQVFMAGVEIDPAGNMWVADTGNNRVLRFSNNGGVIAKTADIVLGQGGFSGNAARGGFDADLTKLLKPISLKFNPNNGELNVLEGEWAGQARVAVYAPPFISGMAASREFGRAEFVDNQPTDTTGWVPIEGKWVKAASGLYWPRGIAFNVTGDRLWVNDGSNQRMAGFDAAGGIAEVIGEPDTNTTGCFGRADQGFINMTGRRQNLCEPTGEIGVGPDGAMYVATIASSDERSITKFGWPLSRNAQGLAVANGRLLFSGWNKFSGKTFMNGYGMVLTGQQLMVSDRQRVLVWNDPANAGTFAQANYILGQDAPDQNANNNGGIFSAIDLGPETAGGGYLWVSAYDRIFAFALPITGGGRNHPAAKILYSGQYSVGNVVWADDGSKVSFRANGLAYDPGADALWVSDSANNRVIRIAEPMGTARVDEVIGQPDKNTTADNAGLGGPTAKGVADPWALQFDKQGNLYVVDARFEGGVNNRVARFAAADLQPDPANIFKFPAATGVYAKQGPGTPDTPTYVAFDSQNRMLLLAESYGNKQYERAFVYGPDHAAQGAPQPSFVLPVAFGQAATAAFYQDDNHVMIQDHTWNRILLTKLEYPGATPTPGVVTVVKQVSGGTDDVNQDGAAFAANTRSVWMGTGINAGNSWTGLRFTNVAIPQKAKIVSAKIEGYSASNQWITMKYYFYGQATGNSQTFTNSSKPGSRSLTSARVLHNSNVAWESDKWYSLDEIAPIVQEIINRSDWVSGNSLAILMKGAGAQYGRKYVNSFEADPTLAPRLVISFE